jgi:quercetin dioxygenase-like cupin family protein
MEVDMTSVDASIATGELWFLQTLVSFPVPHEGGSDGISVIHSEARRGDSPPLHVHTTEDEVFHVIDGCLRVVLDGTIRSVGPGETILAPKGVPHTYCVDSARATWLAITTNGDFERFVRALARVPEGEGLPAAQTPTEKEQRMLAETAAEHGIELVGPPLS